MCARGGSPVWRDAAQKEGSYIHPHSKVENLRKALSVVPGIKLPLNKWKLLLAITRSCRINMAHLPGVPISLND